MVRMKHRLPSIILNALVISACGSAGWAQQAVLGPSNSQGGEGPRSGLQIYSTTLSTTYYGAVRPIGIDSTNVQNILGDGSIDGAVSIGWSRSRGRSSFSVMYSPMYSSRFRYSDLSALNQTLAIGFSRNLSPKWSFHFALGAVDSNFSQFLFTPTQLGSLSQLPATFDDLRSAAVGGKLTNDQLASFLTGAPSILSTSSTLLYGTRMFSSTLQTGLSYSPTPRWSLNMNFGGGHAQGLGVTGRTENIGRLVGNSSAGSLNVEAGYSLSPKTQIGTSVGLGRTFSRIQSAYNDNVSVFISRTIGRHMFVRADGGGGMLMPIGQQAGKRLNYIGGATVGYKTFAHTLLFSYERAITDPYGSGLGNTFITKNGTWSWNRPGRSWWVQSSIEQSQLNALVQGGHVGSWMAMAGFGRRLTSQLAFSTQYGVGRLGSKSLVVHGVPYQLSQSGFRLSLIWTPQIQLIR